MKGGARPDGTRVSHYDLPESVGLANGCLIAAQHQASRETLTHTPNPMGRLNQLCGRKTPVECIAAGL